MIHNKEKKQQLRTYQIEIYKYLNNKWIFIKTTFTKSCYPDYLNRLYGGIRIVKKERYYRKITPTNIID